MADATLFKVVFPEFGATTDLAINYWLAQAVATLDINRLGATADLATMLFAAHNITLGLAQAAAAAKGNPPGAPSGPISSKAAGGLSISYDVTLTAIEGAGVYNATVYGQRLWKMLEIAAMGGLYRAPPRRRHVFGYGLGGGGRSLF